MNIADRINNLMISYSPVKRCFVVIPDVDSDEFREIAVSYAVSLLREMKLERIVIPPVDQVICARGKNKGKVIERKNRECCTVADVDKYFSGFNVHIQTWLNTLLAEDKSKIREAA